MHDTNIASQEAPDEIRKAPLPLRDDTILGVCEGLGEDFGFNPLPLRIALSAGLLWNPAAIIGIYLGLGLLVAISRFLFPPVRKPAAAAEQAPVEAAAKLASTEAQEEKERELIAA